MNAALTARKENSLDVHNGRGKCTSASVFGELGWRLPATTRTCGWWLRARQEAQTCPQVADGGTECVEDTHRDRAWHLSQAVFALVGEGLPAKKLPD